VVVVRTDRIARLGLFVACVVGASQPILVWGEDAPKKGTATEIKITVPRDDATLLIDGKEVAGTGKERLAKSLVAGKSANVTLKVIWEPNNYTKITRVRKLELTAGKAVEVDLTVRNAKTDPPDDIVVRYVPTPDDVVDKMAELAKVGKDDVVFDLGCGDGRMVCRAVAKFSAKRGVGIDIDPERVKDSRETALQYKVQDKVKFRQGDVLKPIDDLPEAGVVMLYMGDDIGARLSPILRKTLKPGARVVSHRFLLGDWKPDKTVNVTDGDGVEYELHLWIVPKN